MEKYTVTQKKIPTPENHPPDPISPYAVAKLSVERYLISYSRLYGISFIFLRFGNIYGPRQNPNGEAGVVAIFIKKMINNQTVVVHGSGKQTKDYIFIEDAIDASTRLFERKKTGIYNIATGKESSVLCILKSLKKNINSDVNVNHVPMPSCGFERGCLSIVKIKRELKWQPKYNLDCGLKKTIEWFSDF